MVTEPADQYGTVLVPIVCRRCQTWKRDATGRALYCTAAWARGRKIVCSACFEAEQTMQAMEVLVRWDDDDLDVIVPF